MLLTNQVDRLSKCELDSLGLLDRFEQSSNHPSTSNTFLDTYLLDLFRVEGIVRRFADSEDSILLSQQPPIQEFPNTVISCAATDSELLF